MSADVEAPCCRPYGPHYTPICRSHRVGTWARAIALDLSSRRIARKKCPAQASGSKTRGQQKHGGQARPACACYHGGGSGKAMKYEGRSAYEVRDNESKGTVGRHRGGRDGHSRRFRMERQRGRGLEGWGTAGSAPSEAIERRLGAGRFLLHVRKASETGKTRGASETFCTIPSLPPTRRSAGYASKRARRAYGRRSARFRKTPASPAGS